MFRTIMDKWINYGLPADKVRDGEIEIRKENINLLLSMSFAVVVIIAIFIWFPFVVKQSIAETLYYLFTGIASAVVMIISSRMKKNPKLLENTIAYKSVCIVFMEFTMLFGVYVGVITNSLNIAGLYLFIFLWAEINFIISVVDNFMVGLSSAAICLICSYFLKTRLFFMYDLANVTVVFIVSMMSCWAMGKQRIERIIAQQELNSANEALSWNSFRDPLTKLYNRRKFFEEKDKYIDSNGCTKTRLVIGIMDIDFFKDYNDTFGHDEGDKVLIRISKIFARLSMKREVLFCRWGGEEFMGIFPIDKDDDEVQLGNELLKAVQKSGVVAANKTVCENLTASIGITVVEEGCKFEWNEIYKKCDEALYIAKNNGRNRVEKK